MCEPAYDPHDLAERVVAYAREALFASGGQTAVIGLSGGKDSAVVAAIMARAIGPTRVWGVCLPNRVQSDIDDAYAVARHLGITAVTFDIGDALSAVTTTLEAARPLTRQARLNLPPRVRMMYLYAWAQCLDDARVINTSNLSEDWIGYATVYGDTAGAFSPLGMLTTDEVIAVGHALGLPAKLVNKAPADGLTGMTDEDVIGFSYATLNRYIRTGRCDDVKARAAIDRMHRASRFKFVPMPMFDPGFPIGADDVAHVYDRGHAQS